MAELTPTERLQPCLLDRLTDEDPKSSQESRNSRVISLQRYREAVLRDLRWLFNANCHLPAEGLDEFGEVVRSVLNYGTRDLTGLLSSSLNIGELEQHLAEAIRLFEPRIIPHSLVVKAIMDPERINSNILAFEIRGDLWARPLPDQLFIKTEIDLETGQCTF
jgi:type VI secretion system protein ImpF